MQVRRKGVLVGIRVAGSSPSLSLNLPSLRARHVVGHAGEPTRREVADGLCASLARLSSAHELVQEQVRDWSVPLVILAVVGTGAACVGVGGVVRRRRKQARYYNMSLSAALGSAPVTHSSGEREREKRARERGRESERERERERELW